MAQDSKLPTGWSIHSLHYADRDPRFYSPGSPPRDSTIAGANAIRVAYREPGSDDPPAFRTIHGANSRDQIADLIQRVTFVVSPV